MILRTYNKRSNWRKSLGFVLVGLLFNINIFAQSLDNAEKHFKELVALQVSNDSTITKDRIYQQALRCTYEYIGVLLSSPSNVSSYSRAKTVLKSLFSTLYGGASYYQQMARNASLSKEYALTQSESQTLSTSKAQKDSLAC